MARIPIQQVPIDATGPLSAANSAVPVLATGMGTAVFGVPVGTWTGTLVAEGTALGDYSDAIALNVIPYGGGASQSGIVAGGIYEIGITGLTGVRLRASGTISGGPITVLVRAAPGNKSIRVGAPAGNPVPVLDANNAAFTSAPALPASGGTPGRSVGIVCTTAGIINLTLSGAGSIALPIYPGWQTFPFAATGYSFSGGGAGSVFNLS